MSNPPIFDGHNDLLSALYLPDSTTRRDFFARSDTGHIDLPRARGGGLGGGFFAVWVPGPDHRGEPVHIPTETGFRVDPDPPLDPDRALRFSLGMTALLLDLARRSDGALEVVTDTVGLDRCLRTGVMAAILHFEGAEAIDEKLEALPVLYEAGLRSLGIVWSRPTVFGHGVPFEFPRSPDTGPGLTDAGKALVRECNQLGILVDLSHLNEKGFWDVAKTTSRPLVATHANAHALCPMTRNLTDRQLDAIKDSDGMVGVNFFNGFLRADGKNDAGTPISVILDHFDYLIQRLGLERVGFGSDFDGASVPAELGDVTGLSKILDGLRDRGYSDDDLARLAYLNWLRVLKLTWV